MADMKRNFTGGKMNKDLDERLIPKGEYRDAQNIQVSTSEGSDVGAIENILGNTLVLDPGDTAGTTQDFILQPSMKCVGKIVDEKNDAFYWFVTDEYTYINYNLFTSTSPQGSNGAKKDMIIQYKDGFITPVFVAFGSYAWTVYNGISWDTASQTITFNQTSSPPTGLVPGMNLQAAGPNSSYSFSSYLNVIASVDLATNTITMVDPIDWMDFITVGYWQHNTKLFFGAGPLSTGTTGTVLGFDPDNFITGINIIDDMLFWTDNLSEPKKINVPRSIEGTVDGFTPTQFLNPERSISVPAREEHITVIKKSPLAPPVLNLNSITPKVLPHQSFASFEDIVNNPGNLFIPGDSVSITINHIVFSLELEGMVVGNTIILEKFPAVGPTSPSDTVFPLRDHVVELIIDTITPLGTNIPPYTTGNASQLDCTLVYIDPGTLLSEQMYLVDIKASSRGIFKIKYPRFATRYKYIDNEYSAFSPFTQPAFIPESWDYQTKKGENLGMQNVMSEALLSSIVPSNIPDGVVQVDILYKESESPNIYLVDKVRLNDGTGNWLANNYSIKSELIYSVIASNQILRPYDNVPRYALAQEITGNRIVYGNYVQNYSSPDQEEKPTFEVNLTPHAVKQTGDKVYDNFWLEYPGYPLPFDWRPSSVTPLRSIKSLREYQFGVVWEDAYGRQSPVDTSQSGAITVPKTESATANLIDIKLSNPPPLWAESFRFYVKENSPEYYNLAMDRWFEAEDGNVWLSFPSSDRNKLTEESTIVLKKSPTNNIPDFENSEYKVIAISNDVPNFVRSNKLSYGIATQEPNTLLGTTIPVSNTTSFSVSPLALYSQDSRLMAAIEDWGGEVNQIKTMFIRFHKTTPPQAVSKYYQIVSLDYFNFSTAPTVSTPSLKVKVSDAFGSDVDFMTNTSGAAADGIGVEFARERELDISAYDGRFFAKIHKDTNIAMSIAKYNFSSSTTIINTINPAFLHYKGENHTQFDDADLNDQLSISGSSYHARSVATGQKTSPADNNWNRIDGNGKLSYTRSGRVSHGVGSQVTGTYGQITPAETGGGNTLTNDTYGEDRYSTGPSGTQGGDYPAEPNFGRFPRPYPFCPYVFNYTSCLGSSGAGNYFKNNVDRGGAFWRNWYLNQGYGSNGWFIDMEPTHSYPLARPTPYYHEYLSPNTTGSMGVQNTPGRGAVLGSKFIDISYTGVDYRGDDGATAWPNTSGSQENQNAHAFLATIGSEIRFNGDPGQIAYKIVSVRVVPGIVNTFDDRFAAASLATVCNSGTINWDYGSSGHGGLWRVRYEIELDQPIGTTVQGLGIITPNDYVLAGGTGDESYVNENDCSVGAPVYAFNWNNSTDIVGNTDASNPTSEGVGCNTAKGAFYDNATGTPNNNKTIDPYLWTNVDGSTRLGFIPTQSNPISYAWEIAGGNQFSVGSAGIETYYAAADWKQTYDNEPPFPNELYNVIPFNSTTFGQGENNTSANPAIWETLPEKTSDIDLYYEASQSYPVSLDTGLEEIFIPIGSTLEIVSGTAELEILTDSLLNLITYNGDNVYVVTSVTGWVSNNTVSIDVAFGTDPVVGDELKFTRPDGSYTTAFVDEYDSVSNQITLKNNVSNNNIGLSYYNCFAFGNGIESNRISDTFNSNTIAKGVKASTVLEEEYKEEHRKYGLIYSGLYNSMSGVNNLNQFIAAEKITKDINPIYGSIQKLHSRSTADGDLITLCEDRCLRILANKDALFNADGNSNVVATDRVLGQTIPFSGNYGISKNPESFASDSYRVYFSDKVRGAIVRLSKDGLTAISDHGMKDFFKDHLKLTTEIHGSFDDKKDEYNLVLKSSDTDEHKLPRTISFKEDVRGWVSFKTFFPDMALSCANEYYTINDGRLFLQHATNSFLNDNLIERNTFYGVFKESSFKVILNEAPGTVKTFHTINYEGSQSKIDQFVLDATTGLTDGEYYNLQAKLGWYVVDIFTDKETGSINEFIEKEGKWFNYIKGDNVVTNGNGSIQINADGSTSWDQASFAIQGIGITTEAPIVVQVGGCMDPLAFNYDPDALIDDGSCVAELIGCQSSTATNFYSLANTDDGSCLWAGCTDTSAFNYIPFPFQASVYANFWSLSTALVDDGSCIPTVLGCTDPTAFNFDFYANVDDGSCLPYILGCDLPNADNYDVDVNANNGTCIWTGCNITGSSNYGWNGWTNSGWPIEATSYTPLNLLYGIQDDGSCLGGGCMDNGVNSWYDPGIDNNGNIYGNQNPEYPEEISPYTGNTIGPWPASNYDPSATYSIPSDPFDPNVPTSCTWASGCTKPWADNYNPQVPLYLPWKQNYTCIISGCLTPTALNYDCATSINSGSTTPCSDGVTTQDGSCVFPVPVLGCTDITALNYDPAADTDDGSCVYLAGCTNMSACNYNPDAITDDNTCSNDNCTGCNDSAALNYESDTTIMSGPYAAGPTCNNNSVPIGCEYDCLGNPAQYGGNDFGCCEYSSVPGCTDFGACNYDASANVDDGSCEYTSCIGCIDPIACNYDPAALIDSGFCVYAGTNIVGYECQGSNCVAVYGCSGSAGLYPQPGCGGQCGGA